MYGTHPCMTIDAEVVTDLGGLGDVTPERRERGATTPYLVVVVLLALLLAGGGLVTTWTDLALVGAVGAGGASLGILADRAILARREGWPDMDEARSFVEAQRLQRFVAHLTTLPPRRVQQALRFYRDSGEVRVVDVEGVPDE